MKLLWTLVKVVIALALLIPAAIIVMSMALGLFGALLGLAFVVLRLAIVGAIGVGAFLLVARLVRGRAPSTPAKPVQALPAPDPHYEAAMRELDHELGQRSS